MKNFTTGAFLEMCEKIPKAPEKSVTTAWKSLIAYFLIFLFFGGVGVYAQQPSASLSQVRNGPADARLSPGNWQNGNLGPTQSHYAEGYSVPYRLIMENLTVGQEVRLILEFDMRHSGKNALDYITGYNRMEPHDAIFGHEAEELDPLLGTVLDNISFDPSNFDMGDIPNPGNSKVVNGFAQPETSFNYIPPGPGRQMSIWNAQFDQLTGSLNGPIIEYGTPGDINADKSSRQIIVRFKVTDANGTGNKQTVVLAWGGHIASRADWGYDGNGIPNSAGGISGSPYHMRTIDWNLNNLGNQDRSLKADAVSPPLLCSPEGPDTVCEGSGPAQYSATVDMGDPTLSYYTWTILNTIEYPNSANASIVGLYSFPVLGLDEIEVNFTSDGEYTVQVTVANQFGTTTCMLTTTVDPGPEPELDTEAVCEGSESVFTATSGYENYIFFTDVNEDNLLDEGDDVHYDGSDNTYSAVQVNGDVIHVQVSDGNDCIGYAYASALVNDNPELSNATVCVGQTVNMGIGSGTYSSSDTSIATVNSSGVVSGISAGSAIITYTDVNGCSDTATVTVQNCIVDEGCTPGYWKNHTDAWAATTPPMDLPKATTDYDFFDFFDIDPVGVNVQDIIGDMDQNADGKLTLLEAISAEIKTSKNNGWFAALARHAVAAYLNATHPDVGYEFSASYILEQTELVFEGPIGPDEYRNRNEANAAALALHDLFRRANERVCPLGNDSPSTSADTSILKLSDPEVEIPSVIESQKEEIISDSEVVNGFNVSPVPFRESLSLQYDFDYVSDATIQMFDLQGRLLLTHREANASRGQITDLGINFRILPSQIYVIKVTTDRDVFTRKIVSDK